MCALDCAAQPVQRAVLAAPQEELAAVLAGAARDWREELGAALGGAEVGALQRAVCVERPRRRPAWEVVALRPRLRAGEHVQLPASDAGEDRGRLTGAPGWVAVEPRHPRA